MKERERLTPPDELSSRLKGKKVFIFDFDGVLADSLADIAFSVNAALEHFGFPPVDTETVRGFVGDGARRLISRCFSAACKKDGGDFSFSESDVDSWLSWYRGHYEAHPVERTRLYPNVDSLLKKIREAGARAAVVTNKPLALASAVSERLGIAEFLDAIIGPEDTGGKAKPAPDGLAEALRRINARLPAGSQCCSARDALMTGDSPQDVLAGKGLPCETCAVLKGYTAPEKLFEAGADFYVNLASDLLNVFS